MDHAGGARLDEVHAGVQGDGRHGAGVVVGHLDGAVPLGGVAVEQQAQRSACQLMQRGDLLQVPGQLKGQVAQQRRGDQHRRARAWPQLCQRPQHPRGAPQERICHLQAPALRPSLLRTQAVLGEDTTFISKRPSSPG